MGEIIRGKGEHNLFSRKMDETRRKHIFKIQFISLGARLSSFWDINLKCFFFYILYVFLLCDYEL